MLISLTGLLLSLPLADPFTTEGRVEDLLRANPAAFGRYLDQAEDFRFQVLFSEVVEGPGGSPELVRHGFRVDAEYFYPASTVKLGAAVAACSTLRQLSAEHGVEVRLDTPLRFHPLFDDDTLEERDPSNLAGGTITVGHAIRKVCLVSDNQAYNWLYELVGHRPLNEYLASAGLVDSHIFHRLSEFRSPEDQRRSPRIELLAEGGTIELPRRASDLLYENAGIPGLTAGVARVSGGERIDEPLSFQRKNRMSLVDLQDMLIHVVRPDIDLGQPGFDLTAEERLFLMRALAEFPRESQNPRYDPEATPDDWVKFFLPGARRVVPEVRIFNKVGRAYGFSVENAYLVDEAAMRGFFLTVVLYTNPNGVLNDGIYGYEELADPLFVELGEVFTRAALR